MAHAHSAYNRVMNTFFRRALMWLCLGLLIAGNMMLGTPRDLLADDAAPSGEAAGETPAQPDAATVPPLIAPKPAPMIVRSGALALPAGGKVAIIPIEGTIYDFTVESVKRRVERAIAAGVDVIVFEMNTNGGVLDSALQISKYIRAQIERPDRTRVPTIAWINDKAYSAGILIASACGHIIMSPAAATGDCAPISALGNSLAPTERAKALSPLLTEFRSNAQDNNYPYAIFHAMCVLGVKLYLVEHKSEIDPVTGGPRRTIVNQIDYQIMVDGKSKSSLVDEVSKLFGASDAIEDITKVGLAKREIATDADRGQWKLIDEVHDGSTLLTLGTNDAVKIGLALPGTFLKDVDIEKYLSASVVYRVDETWSETMAGFLVSMPVRAALIVIFLLGVVIEMMAPGISVFGMVAAGAMILLIISPMLVGLAEVWHLLLFFIGFLLLMAEIFVTPGFGVLGISGIIGMLTGVILAVVPTTGKGPMPLPPPEMMATLQASAMWTLLGLIVGCVGLFFVVKHYGQLPFFNRMVLTASQPLRTNVQDGLPRRDYGYASQNGEDGEGSMERPEEHPDVAAAREAIAGDELANVFVRVGDEGRVTADLRPMGKALFHDHVIDVQSVGGFVDTGKRVRVVKTFGNRVTVEMI